MAYNEISRMNIWDIIRRWHSRHSISQIAQALGYDRKTVRSYIQLAQRIGLSLEDPLPEKEAVLARLQEPRVILGRAPSAQKLLEVHLAEIIQLVNDPDIALKPKSAFAVITERHDLSGKVSYPTFKRFVRAHSREIRKERTTCRIEVPPGSEAQLDYAQVCLWHDPSASRHRRLFVFIGTLSHSRHKYAELTFVQDQVSFTQSHVRMFEDFGGVPEHVVIDNLKTGVVRPDLYDPRFNRSYAELAEHYGFFLDPARVRHPRDKGKVERDVQTIREAARRIMHMNPGASLNDLNHALRQWITSEYGNRVHGTTGERPRSVFIEREQSALRRLPDRPFEVAQWKLASVHPDHYVQFRGKAYSVPHAYVGRQVWIRATDRILQVFHQEQLIKQHVITRHYRHTDFNDFPASVQHSLDTSTIHRTLLERALKIGPEFGRVIRDLLEAHAFINLRRAQGLVAVAEEASNTRHVENAARFIAENRLRATPHDLRHALDRFAAQQAAERTLPPLSEATQEFVRDASYFIHHGEGEAA